jgi:hypothetical protein
MSWGLSTFKKSLATVTVIAMMMMMRLVEISDADDEGEEDKIKNNDDEHERLGSVHMCPASVSVSCGKHENISISK